MGRRPAPAAGVLNLAGPAEYARAMDAGRPSPLDDDPAPPPDPLRPIQIAVYVLPVVSVLLAAFVFLGPGALRAFTYARIRGVPAEGARTMALRLEVLRSVHDVAAPIAMSDLAVEASATGQALSSWRGATDQDGIADVVLQGSTPVRGRFALTVTGPAPGGTRQLAGGEIALRRAAPAFVQLGSLRGAQSGDLEVRVDAARGLMASPFAETLRVSITKAGAPIGKRIELTLSGAGAEITPDHVTTGENGVATVRVTALAHHVDLVVVANAGEQRARWEGTLPIVPGALWIDPASVAAGGALAIVSAAPRARAYLSLWSEEGRVLGATVPLQRDDRGFYRGAAELPRLDAKLVYATLAGDPLEQGSGTVAWPIRPPEGAVSGAPAMDLLMDGFATAKAREQKRAWAARRSGLVLLGLTALAEMLLLLVQARASQRRLEAHLSQASAPDARDKGLSAVDREKLLDAAREHPVLRAVVMVSLVALAFAMIAALGTFR